MKHDELAAAIATDLKFELYVHYTEAQAAKIIGVHAVTLKKRRLNGEVAYVQLGQRTIRYFGYQIANHLIENIKCQNVKPEAEVACSKSVTCGSAKETTVLPGMLRPMTNAPSARDVAAFAQATFQ